MADLDGDSIYTATLLIPAGMQEFKYTIGGWNDQEALTPGDACVVTTGPNTNRVINVNGDATLPTICWNSCSSCSAVPTLDQMDLPVTFEDVTTVNYVFEDFGGNASMLVVDPTDATNMVAQSTKDITAQLWAGTTLDEVPGAVHVGFVNAIPFSATETTMSVRVWSPVGGIPVRLKAENSSNNTISVETEAMVTAANTWETLVFDFANEATGTAALNLANTYDMVSIFFDFGTDGATAGASRTYYWDDVTFGGSATGPCTGVTPDPMILDDFECQGNISYSFANATWTPNIANPDQSGLNTSSMVGEFIHWGAGTDGAFGGSLDLGPIDISTNNLLKVDVWTNATALPITIVLQNGTPADILSQTKSTSATGMWQTLEFDMLGAASSTDVSNIVIVINPGTTIQDTIYIDNIRFDGTAVNPCESVVADENIMEDFDCQRNLDYQFTEGGFTTIPNPDMSGLNTSANVGQYTRNNTVADAFGGDFIFAPLDFASNNQVKMTVWDANAPSNVTLVLQNAAGVDLGSAVAATTTANVWEDINFDFSAIPNSAGVSKVVILFDAGTQADSGQVYFFDNLRLEGFISGISEINSTAITVYPNPSNDFLNVDVSALESNESLTFTVYSIDGKIVNETILNNTKNVVQLDLTNVTKGFYVLEVASSSKKHLTKFIKN